MTLEGDPTGLRGIDEDQTLIPIVQGLRTLCWGRSRKADRNIQYTHRYSNQNCSVDKVYSDQLHPSGYVALSRT